MLRRLSKFDVASDEPMAVLRVAKRRFQVRKFGSVTLRRDLKELQLLGVEAVEMGCMRGQKAVEKQGSRTLTVRQTCRLFSVISKSIFATNYFFAALFKISFTRYDSSFEHFCTAPNAIFVDFAKYEYKK